MSTSTDLISQLARLARLKLSPDEERAFAEQIPKILAYVEQLGSIETESIPPTDQTPAQLRPDQSSPLNQSQDILGLAPERVDRFWKVPPVK